MTLGYALSILVGTALANLLRVYVAKYQTWKAARSEIPAYRNWRGEYVPDLKLKRIERGIIIAWVLFTLACLPIAYTIMSPDGPYAHGTSKPADSFLNYKLF